METSSLKLSGTEVQYSFLKAGGDRWIQFYYSITPDRPEQIAEQIRTIEQAESELFGALEVNHETAVWKRFFSSDLISHKDEIMSYKERQGTDFFMSLTEQPPASHVKAALMGMCICSITAKFREGNVFHFDTASGIKHIFAEHLVDPNASEHADAEQQTDAIFSLLREKLSAFDATIEDNVLRTWIYAPHVDADYPGIVRARKELFDAIDLTKDTHYIASTGIQGGSASRFARVFMDAYAVAGIGKERVHYIQAPEYLSPTHIYGVTFERATAVELSRTSFLFISGTASIDRDGEIVHPGDVVKQTDRTLENISALLDSAGFVRGDLASFIVYLRDPADYGFVRPQIEQYADNLPAVYVKAPVCRPGWLIEIEATAAKVKR
ncbi:Rid family hydrolase [Planctomycetota bacterium]